MIVSSGYNISGPEVEAAMSLHPGVQECAVIGWPDEERGQIVKAVVVSREGVTSGPELVRALQDHMKRTLAPYKCPRTIAFSTILPKTPTGKLKRSALRLDIPRYQGSFPEQSRFNPSATSARALSAGDTSARLRK